MGTTRTDPRRALDALASLGLLKGAAVLDGRDRYRDAYAEEYGTSHHARMRNGYLYCYDELAGRTGGDGVTVELPPETGARLASDLALARALNSLLEAVCPGPVNVTVRRA